MPKVMHKILVIDDDPVLIRLLEKTLTSHAYIPVSAMDGKNGIRLAQQECPDLIILDIKIPDMSGGDVARELQKGVSTKDIPIIFLTIVLSGQKGKKHIEVDGQSYRAIAKPFYQPELISAIRKEINRHLNMPESKKNNE